jgi:hypothetical protein
MLVDIGNAIFFFRPASHLHLQLVRVGRRRMVIFALRRRLGYFEHF